MVWESQRGVWMKNWRWINLVLLQSEWKCESCEVRPWGWGSGCKDKESLEWECLGLGLIFFFVFIVPLKPNWFGSVGVLPVSGFGNRNRTEPKIFTKKIIGLIGFFFRFGFFGYFFLGLLGFSVFLLTPNNYATCTAFKWWGCRDSLVVLEARFWPPDDTYLLKARITIHSLFLNLFIYQITFVVTQFLTLPFW